MQNKLVVTLLVFLAGIGALVYFRDQITSQREAARAPAGAPPATPALTLEQRAAAAQGTVYPEQKPEPLPRPRPATPPSNPPAAVAATPKYQCDGRVYCSQMHSCEEAKWFLQHCPGTKMDNEGHGNGIPCERQWCGSH